ARHFSVKPRPVRRSLMRDCSTRSLTDQARIFCQRTCAMTWRALLPIAPASGEFLLVDQQVHAAASGINPDLVAVADKRQRAANKRLRRYIADTHAARGAGEPPIRDQGHLLAHALAVDERGNAKHLAH